MFHTIYIYTINAFRLCNGFSQHKCTFCVRTKRPHYWLLHNEFLFWICWCWALMEFIRWQKKNQSFILCLSRSNCIVFFSMFESTSAQENIEEIMKKKKHRCVRTLNQFIFTDCLFLCFFFLSSFIYLFIFFGAVVVDGTYTSQSKTGKIAHSTQQTHTQRCEEMMFSFAFQMNSDKQTIAANNTRTSPT